MRVQIELNKTKLIVRIVSTEGNINPGYVCESDVDSKIYLSASEAINKTYNKLFNNKTRYSGPSVLGFDNENITQELLSDVLFCHFKITVDKLSILIIELGDDMIGYLSSFMYKYQGKQSLFVQKIESKYYYIEVFQKKERVPFYSDFSPTKVWEKTGILKNYNGRILFGIEYPATINALKNYAESPICSMNEWNNIEVMSEAFEKHLKWKISVVELGMATPEFWTCSMDSSSESTALLYLFNKNLLNGVDNKEPEFIKKNKQLKVIIEKFWKSFKEAIRVNKCGLDEK
ncbi:hypothetical protein GLOIN_2v1535567 [Rhizophagus clarus]|uniref:Uncharacterized protein n=1 Tax=Rhizophagus clarus TaxID=94130 RepID=A0A8H3R3K2_9GLOM|nr:hypothetical protein GLOIN_2v1535567 [Rhizophagus clarus]